MRSIRRYLLMELLLGTGCVFVLFTALFYFYTRQTFVRQFDQALSEKLATHAGLVEVVRDVGLAFRFEQLPSPEFQPSQQAAYFQLWGEGGGVLARSPSLGTDDLPLMRASAGSPTFHELRLPDGRPGRAAVLRFVARPANRRPPENYDASNPQYQLVMAMARSSEDLDAAEAILLQGCVLFGLLIALATASVVWHAVRRGLSPLDRMAHRLAAIQAHELTTRVENEGMPEELQPVVARLNALLDRLERAFQRERRLTADVAHELRTPIAELVLLTELQLRNLDDGALPAAVADRGAIFEDVLEIARQMEAQIGTLLALARCDAGAEAPNLEDVDLAALVRAAWRSHLTALEVAGFACELKLPAEAPAKSDPRLLGAILSNLLSNAVAYTPSGGFIIAELEPAEQGYRFRLSNSDHHLRPGDLKHLFEPFWRRESARSDSKHVGLGLSLVRSYADLLHVDVAADLPQDGCFTVTLRIPSSWAIASARGSEVAVEAEAGSGSSSSSRSGRAAPVR